MNKWSEFLATQESQSLQRNNSMYVLDESALLYVGGEDATDFLQNQLSNDIQKLNEKTAQLSTISNAKGRMLGIFRIIKIDGGYLLIMPKDILPDIQQQLQKFIIMAKVVLADITDSFAIFSFSTDQQDLVSTEAYPSELNQVYQSDSLISLRLESAENRYRFLILSNNEQEAVNLWTTLSQKLIVNDSTGWRLQEIEAAVPTIYPQTVGAFVLQMSNLQLIGGVSFKKGCFPGQEVVARMQYLGKLKRRMYLAEINSTTCPKPGDELCVQGAEKKDGSGKVVDAVQINPQQCILLFIAQIEKTEKNELVLFDQPGHKLKLKDLPYLVTE